MAVYTRSHLVRSPAFWSAALCAGAITIALLRTRRAAAEPGMRSDETARPSWKSFLNEYPAAGRLLFDQLKPARSRARPGAGRRRPVMVIPGLITNDLATLYLRRRLKASGFHAHGWSQGFNRGVRGDLFDRLSRRLDEIVADSGGPVAVVGWSLGGLYARELAKRRPGDISVVVTLGAPFSVDLRDNNAWKLYEAINDHRVDEAPIEMRVEEKPPVHTVAIWSDRDGIVAPASASGTSLQSDEQIKLRCKHNELVSHPDAIDAVLDILERHA